MPKPIKEKKIKGEKMKKDNDLCPICSHGMNSLAHTAHSLSPAKVYVYETKGKIKKIVIGYDEISDEETIDKRVSCGGKDERLAKKINEIIDRLNEKRMCKCECHLYDCLLCECCIEKHKCL